MYVQYLFCLLLSLFLFSDINRDKKKIKINPYKSKNASTCCVIV